MNEAAVKCPDQKVQAPILSISGEGITGNKERPSKRHLRVLTSVAGSISKGQRRDIPMCQALTATNI